MEHKIYQYEFLRDILLENVGSELRRLGSFGYKVIYTEKSAISLYTFILELEIDGMA